MTRRYRLLGIYFAVGALAVLGGFAVGKSDAPTEEEAAVEQNSAQITTFKSTYKEAFADSREDGLKQGKVRGKLAGRSAGEGAGRRQGTSGAETELAAIAAAEAEAAEQAALAEEAERLENCGAPLFPDSSCPTDEEIALEVQAETLCGGGRYEEAAALGIEC